MENKKIENKKVETKKTNGLDDSKLLRYMQQADYFKNLELNDETILYLMKKYPQ